MKTAKHQLGCFGLNVVLKSKHAFGPLKEWLIYGPINTANKIHLVLAENGYNP
jgi:hypothetical protein